MFFLGIVVKTDEKRLKHEQPRNRDSHGSKSDLNKMSKAAVVFEEKDVAYEMKILSAHRLPDMTADYARSARERGLEVIICGADTNMEYLQVISAFEKPDFHVITSRWTMDKTLIIFIL